MPFRPALCSIMMICPGVGARAQQPLLQWADAPQWSVAWYIMGQPIGTNACYSTGEQVVCGESYNVVEGLFGAGPGYYRNEGQRTFVRSSSDCALPERLMYDYGLGVGDSTYVGWHMTSDGMDTALAILESVDTIAHLGALRRRFNMLVDRCPSPWEEPLLTPMAWVEGIGSTIHPFYPLICLCDFCETSTGLLCADSLGIAVYRSIAGVSCAQTISVDELDGRPSALLVRRSAGGLEILIPDGASDGMLSVADAAGRLLVEQRIGAGQRSAVIEDGNAGLLLVHLHRSDGKRWVAKWAPVPQ